MGTKDDLGLCQVGSACSTYDFAEVPAFVVMIHVSVKFVLLFIIFESFLLSYNVPNIFPKTGFRQVNMDSKSNVSIVQDQCLLNLQKLHIADIRAAPMKLSRTTK